MVAARAPATNTTTATTQVARGRFPTEAPFSFYISSSDPERSPRA